MLQEIYNSFYVISREGIVNDSFSYEMIRNQSFGFK